MFAVKLLNVVFLLINIIIYGVIASLVWTLFRNIKPFGFKKRR